ncbi:hypothetical protein SAMN05444166_6415 [Singulisphaera sp. GP187]|uniref:hypothetical protein n=1 Tax=Singulisphaera sp. GP187 TaxID=1882752 RepID=UPI000925A483|nr:hypothetical protein [Singulisphaera sp. GP187]SIO60498.1 hypothetical protein SAMN05444166_6415 [Singulisphaera sp. GP187]
MVAVLRADGTQFDPDQFMAESHLEACKLYRKDEPLFPELKPEGKKHSTSGITFVVSDADFHDFPQQIVEATAYLEINRDELSRLRDFAGIESVTLDFGIAQRDVMVQCDYLPPSLIRLAGELELGIEITQYPIDTDGADSEPG